MITFLLIIALTVPAFGKIQHGLDAHVHFVFSGPEGEFEKNLIEYLETTEGMAFALSPSYAINQLFPADPFFDYQNVER